MIFALADYVAYQCRSGRFARFSPGSPMGSAFLGGSPDEVIALLRAGDLFFTSVYGNVGSWAVMYFTSSEISHVAIYLGDGRIAHATTRAVGIDQIQELYRPDTRILPYRLPLSDEQRAKVIGLASGAAGLPYSWRSVRVKFLDIVTGRDVPYFRWRIFGDIITACAAIDILLLLTIQVPLASWCLLPLTASILLNKFRWRTTPLPFDENYAKPIDVLLWTQSVGAQAFRDGDAINEQRRRLGLGPLESTAPAEPAARDAGVPSQPPEGPGA